jgi:hypothetical protein
MERQTLHAGNAEGGSRELANADATEREEDRRYWAPLRAVPPASERKRTNEIFPSWVMYTAAIPRS